MRLDVRVAAVTSGRLRTHLWSARHTGTCPHLTALAPLTLAVRRMRRIRLATGTGPRSARAVPLSV